MAVSDDELVSSDFLGWQQSCIVDSHATVMLNSTTAKIICFYDNEVNSFLDFTTSSDYDADTACDTQYAYSVRLLDLAIYMYYVDNDVPPTPAPSGRSSPVHFESRPSPLGQVTVM